MLVRDCHLFCYPLHVVTTHVPPFYRLNSVCPLSFTLEHYQSIPPPPVVRGSGGLGNVRNLWIPIVLYYLPKPNPLRFSNFPTQPPPKISAPKSWGWVGNCGRNPRARKSFGCVFKNRGDILEFLGTGQPA